MPKINSLLHQQPPILKQKTLSEQLQVQAQEPTLTFHKHILTVPLLLQIPQLQPSLLSYLLEIGQLLPVWNCDRPQLSLTRTDPLLHHHAASVFASCLVCVLDQRFECFSYLVLSISLVIFCPAHEDSSSQRHKQVDHLFSSLVDSLPSLYLVHLRLLQHIPRKIWGDLSG